MVAIPQDIIYNIIEAVASDNDRRLLRKCALVSSSFLLPCRKHLFSELILRTDRACQRLHQFLVENPVVQSFVRRITIKPMSSNSEYNPTSLIAILRLSFCCLESFSITGRVRYPLNWNDFSTEMKDALSTVIHSSTLKNLYVNKINVPIMLFLDINLNKLELTDFRPDKFDGESWLPKLATTEGVPTTASHTVVDYCVCRYLTTAYGTRFPTSGYFALI